MDNKSGRKTFSNILVAIHESSKLTDHAVDYATKIAQDYNARLVVLYVIRTETNLQTLNLPSHVIRFKRQAEAYLSKISEKVYDDSNTEHIVKIKTEIIASIRIADCAFFSFKHGAPSFHFDICYVLSICLTPNKGAPVV